MHNERSNTRRPLPGVAVTELDRRLLAQDITRDARCATHRLGEARCDQTAVDEMDMTRSRSRVVVVGGGFGGLQAVKALARAEVDVTLIDRNNYHLFQPLSYQVATGSLSPGEIAVPLRQILRREPRVRVVMGEVTGV